MVCAVEENDTDPFKEDVQRRFSACLLPSMWSGDVTFCWLFSFDHGPTLG